MQTADTNEPPPPISSEAKAELLGAAENDPMGQQAPGKDDKSEDAGKGKVSVSGGRDTGEVRDGGA